MTLARSGDFSITEAVGRTSSFSILLIFSFKSSNCGIGDAYLENS